MNIACAELFGYFRDELAKRELKINTLMPSIFASKHDEFLRKFHFRNDCETKNAFLKSRLLFGMHKNKYIFPFYLKIRVTQSKSTCSFF